MFRDFFVVVLFFEAKLFIRVKNAKTCLSLLSWIVGKVNRQSSLAGLGILQDWVSTQRALESGD